MHIPKAGGTTLNAILSRQYHPSRTFSFTGDFDHDANRFRSLAPDARASIQLVIGHASLTTNLPEVDEATTFTMLRDPVARVKSFCQHAAEGKSAYLLEGHPPEAFDLDAFLWSGDPHLSNQQAKMLINSGDIGNDAMITKLGRSAARELALEGLFSRITEYGLQEYFDESLFRFADRFGWSLPWYFSKNRSAAGRRLVFEPRHIDRIRELNEVDLEVYAIARDEFLKRRVADPPTLRSFQTANRVASPAMALWDDVRLRALYWYRRSTGQLDG